MLKFKVLTEGEAVQNYRFAKDPEEQITILSQILGGTEYEVKDMLRSHGCEIPGDEAPKNAKRGYAKWSEEDITIAKARFNEGVSCEDIARELGRDKKCVNMKLNSLGCSFSKRNLKKHEGKQESVGTEEKNNSRCRQQQKPKTPPSTAESATYPSLQKENCEENGDNVYDENGSRSFTVKEAAEEMERLCRISDEWKRAAEKLECETPKELKERIAEMLSCVGRLTLENKREKERTELILGKFEKVIRFAREKCDG